MMSDQSLDTLRQYTNEGRELAMRTINQTIDKSSGLKTIKAGAEQFWEAILRSIQRVRSLDMPNPEMVFDRLRQLFRDEICQNNIFYICVGLGIGTTGGIMLGMWWARPKLAAPVMKSIACIYIKGSDNVTLCHTSIPTFIHSTDIIIRVRAVSIDRLDERISQGYGRNLRQMIQQYNNTNNTELPLVIGRACSGVVEGVGRGAKSGLEIGDEVWLAAPWYETGLASELVVAPECRIGRKPFILGFEAAASLPYSGCVALNALSTVGLNELNGHGKRILVQDGCSPVGCVLTQLAKRWGAYVTATCRQRSVPVIKALGADDVIALHNEADQPVHEEQQILFKELSIRKEYDFVFFTTATKYDKEFIRSFVAPHGLVLDTVEPDLPSNLGFVTSLFYSIYVRLKKFGSKFTKNPPNWGGPHLCHLALDQLASYVNDGILQSVVDQVYTPQDAEASIIHVCDPKSVGSTIITFRS